VVRYRKAVTYGVHALLAALEAAGADCEVRLAASPAACAAQIADATADRVLVLWSFYSPDADAMSAELNDIRAPVPHHAVGRVLHIAGGVHATAEPQHILDSGWDWAPGPQGDLYRLCRLCRPITISQAAPQEPLSNSAQHAHCMWR